MTKQRTDQRIRNGADLWGNEPTETAPDLNQYSLPVNQEQKEPEHD